MPAGRRNRARNIHVKVDGLATRRRCPFAGGGDGVRKGNVGVTDRHAVVVGAVGALRRMVVGAGRRFTDGEAARGTRLETERVRVVGAVNPHTNTRELPRVIVLVVD